MTPTHVDSIPVSPVPDLKRGGGRLGFALLGYLLGVTLIITLLPFQFGRPLSWRVMVTGDALDVVANVLLFVPLGFLFRLASSNRHRHSTMQVLWFGALLSSAIEVAQQFERERYTSLLDVLANATGAWVGAQASDRLASRLARGDALVGRFSLELPLLGLLYLMVPLLWLNALASGDAREHAALSLLIGAAGATVAAGVHRHHLGPERGVAARSTALLAALWFMAGAFPLLRGHSVIVGGGALLVGAFSWVLSRRPLPELRGCERRYEIRVLISCVPAFACYLAFLGAGPLLAGPGAWQWGFGFPGVAVEWTRTEILRLLELVAAFTLAGYAVAEHRGRVFQSYRSAVRRIASFGMAAALLVEGLRGFHAGHGASVARACVLVASGLYGGWLYYLQRRQVLRLLNRSAS